MNVNPKLPIYHQTEQNSVSVWLDSITGSMNMGVGKLWKIVKDGEAWHESMGSQRVGHDLATEHREGDGTPLQYLAWKIPWTEEPGGL